jgi:hypothetical protein
MPRPRQTPQDDSKEAISTRLYAETVRILRILAEAKKMSMADFTHDLALDAMRRYGPELISEVKDLMGLAEKKHKGEGS